MGCAGPLRWFAPCRASRDQLAACGAASKLGLRTHLVIFGLAIVVPVLLYSAFLLHRYTQSERASNERRALEIARALSADIDREITAITTTLETLATSPALGHQDFMASTCRPRRRCARGRPGTWS